MIIYIIYLSKIREWYILVKHIKLISLVRDIRECLFTIIFGFLNTMHLNLHKLVAIVTDATALMTREQHKLVVRFQKKSTLIDGCSLYWEALATQNANKYFLDLHIID